MQACVHVFAFETHLLKTQLFSEMTSWQRSLWCVRIAIDHWKVQVWSYVTKATGKNRNQAIFKQAFHFWSLLLAQATVAGNNHSGEWLTIA